MLFADLSFWVYDFFFLVAYCLLFFLQGLLLVDTFVRRQQDLEETVDSEVARREKLEADVERLSVEIDELRAEKLKLNDCLEREKLSHSKATEALANSSSELLKKNELLEGEKKARAVAEKRSVELEKVIGVQKQKIEDLELQLESEKHVTDAARRELASIRLTFNNDEGVFEMALRLSSELSAVMTRLGARPALRKFGKGDTLGALNWCVNTLEMLPRAIKTFAGFSCATGARAVGASIERKCEHIAEAVKKDFKLSGAAELADMSDVVRKLGRKVYYLLWEKGDLEDFARNEACERSKKVCSLQNLFNFDFFISV